MAVIKSDRACFCFVSSLLDSLLFSLHGNWYISPAFSLIVSKISFVRFFKLCDYVANWLTDIVFVDVVVAQEYVAEADNEYVINGNSAIFKCEIPSFVADFVHVTSWTEEGSDITYHHSKEFGTEMVADRFTLCSHRSVLDRIVVDMEGMKKTINLKNGHF